MVSLVAEDSFEGTRALAHLLQCVIGGGDGPFGGKQLWHKKQQLH
jgi:hypothetical protein